MLKKTQQSSAPQGRDEMNVRFEEVYFEYGHNKPILDEVSFSVRRGTKIKIMGQNGGGKSTIFGMIIKDLQPEAGDINIVNGLTIATARQVIPRDQMELTIRDFFLKAFEARGAEAKKIYDIDPR